MGEKHRATGRTVDEAIFKGLNELEISIDEVDVEIIQSEHKGVFGIGSKPAVVLLTKRDTAHHFDPEMLKTTPPPRHENREYGSYNNKKTSGSNKPRSAYGNTPRRSQGYSERQKNANENHQNALVQGEIEQERAAVQAPMRREPTAQRPQQRKVKPVDVKSEGEQSGQDRCTEEMAKNCITAQFIANLLDKMGIDAKVTAFVGENVHKINIETEEELGRLIGHRGETLDALQYLASLVANKSRGEEAYTKVAIDIGDYRQRRYEKLVRTARSKASFVRSSGRSYKFEPMSSFERRIIHSALQNHSAVITFSEGEEPKRYVIIAPKRGKR